MSSPSRIRFVPSRVTASRSGRSEAFPGSSATAALAYQVDGAISRTQLQPALADGLRRLRSQNLPDRRTRHRQIPADPDQPPLHRKWRISPIIAEFEGGRGQPSARVGGCLETPARLTTDISGPSSAPRSAWGSDLNADFTQKRVTFVYRVTCKLAPQHEQKPQCNPIGCESDKI